MSALERIAAAEAYLRGTTITYPLWESRVAKNYYPNVKTTGWWKALDALAQAKAELQNETGRVGQAGLVYLFN